MQTLPPLYDDIATLSERVIKIAISSKKTLSLIHFYDAYRELHEFNKSLHTVLVHYFSVPFSSHFFQNSSFGSPEEKWRIVFNRDLIRATMKCRSFLLRLGEIHFVQDSAKSSELCIERFIPHKIYYTITRDEYDLGLIEKGTFSLNRKIFVMPDRRKPISDGNRLSLSKYEENIEELGIRIRLVKEGQASLARLRAIELEMKLYLMKDVSLKDLLLESYWVTLPYL